MVRVSSQPLTKVIDRSSKQHSQGNFKADIMAAKFNIFDAHMNFNDDVETTKIIIKLKWRIGCRRSR